MLWKVNSRLIQIDVKVSAKKGDSRQTFEFRVPDGSANIHLILAGLIVASLHGIQMPNALELADQLYVEGNIFRSLPKQELQQLPASCVESAERLKSKREIFENNGIFPKRLINHTIDSLTAFQDKNLSSELEGNPEAARESGDKVHSLSVMNSICRHNNSSENMGINLLIIKRSDGTHMPESIHFKLYFHSPFLPPPLKSFPAACSFHACFKLTSGLHFETRIKQFKKTGKQDLFLLFD